MPPAIGRPLRVRRPASPFRARSPTTSWARSRLRASTRGAMLQPMDSQTRAQAPPATSATPRKAATRKGVVQESSGIPLGGKLAVLGKAAQVSAYPSLDGRMQATTGGTQAVRVSLATLMKQVAPRETAPASRRLPLHGSTVASKEKTPGWIASTCHRLTLHRSAVGTGKGPQASASPHLAPAERNMPGKAGRGLSHWQSSASRRRATSG